MNRQRTFKQICCVISVLFLLLIAQGTLCWDGAAEAGHYICDVATCGQTCGAGCSGDDWNNAWPDIPDYGTSVEFEDGHTYYVADGSYSSFSTRNDNSLTDNIKIIKATNDNSEVTSIAGWQASFGDGQAVISAPVSLWGAQGFVLDGRHGSGKDESSYGFKIVREDCSVTGSNQYSIHNENNFNFSNSKFKYLAIEACGPDYVTAQIGIRLVPVNVDPRQENVEISHNYFYNFSVAIHINGGGNLTLKHNYFKDQWFVQGVSNGNTHSLTYADDVTIAYDTYENCCAGTGCIAPGHGSYSVNTNFDIYGNVFLGGPNAGRRPIACGGLHECHNFKVYQNTFASLEGNFNIEDGAPESTGWEIKNNIFYNLTITEYSMTGDHSSNWCYGGTGCEYIAIGPGYQEGTGDPFVNSANGDYRLAAHTNPGEDLGAPFNIDKYGNVRSNWDRGAYEYTGPLNNYMLWTQ